MGMSRALIESGLAEATLQRQPNEFRALGTSFLGKGGEDNLWREESKYMNIGPDAEVLPLCEDLNGNTVGRGDSCWSTCKGQCPNDVLKPGVAFDFDEIGPGHPGCTSHFECVGNKDRVLCHGVRAAEAGLNSLHILAAEVRPQPEPSKERSTSAAGCKARLRTPHSLQRQLDRRDFL